MLSITWRRTLLPALAACALTGCLSLVGHAQEAAAPRWRTSVGLFAPLDIPSSVRVDAGITVAFEFALSTEPRMARQWLGTFRYAHYTLGGGQDINLYTPTIELRQYLRPARSGRRLEGWWVSGGLGMMFGDNSAGEHVWHLAHTLAAGYDASSLFLEARMLRGTQSGDHGFIASLGWRW